MEIRGFLDTSFLDWDGKVVATVFLPRCNFRCPFCHNAGLIESPQSYPLVPLEKVEGFLLKHRDFLDGICVTGGEPCLHKERGLYEFLARFKELGFAVKLDTNGADPDCVRELVARRLVDFFAMDVKGPLDERYDRLSGVKTDLARVKESIKLIRESGLDHEFRVTVVPTLLYIHDIEDIARYLRGAKKLVLQQFVAENAWEESLRGLQPYPPAEIKAMAEVAARQVERVVTRGI